MEFAFLPNAGAYNLLGALPQTSRGVSPFRGSDFHLRDCKFCVEDAYFTPKKRNTTQAPEGFTVMVNTALSLGGITGDGS